MQTHSVVVHGEDEADDDKVPGLLGLTSSIHNGRTCLAYH